MVGVKMPITENNWHCIVLFSLEEVKLGHKKPLLHIMKQFQNNWQIIIFLRRTISFSFDTCETLKRSGGSEKNMAGKHTTGTEPQWLHKTLCMTPSSKPLTSTPQGWLPVHFTSLASLTQPSAIIKTFAVKLIERQIKNKLRKMRCRMPTCTS